MHEVNRSIVDPEQYGLDTKPLSYEDRQWLTHLGMEWPSLEQEESWLAELNAAAIRGNEHIKPGMPEEQVREVMETRQVFLSLLTNVADETVEELRGLNRTLMPTGTIIATQRVLEANGISGLAVNGFPPILSYGPDGVSEKIRVLSDLNIELPAVVRAFPDILSYSPQAVREKVGALSALGINGGEVVGRYPQILKLNSQQVTDRAAYFASYGLNVPRAITALPSLINLLPETVSRKISELERLGIQRASIADNPVILGYAVKSVEEKMELLRRMDLDPVVVIAEAPEVLSYAQHSVEQKVHTIKQLGFTPKKILSKHPILLYYASESLAIKVRALQDLGMTSNGIERGPQVLNFTPDYVAEKLRALHDLGLPAVKIANSHPAILNLRSEYVGEKLAFLTGLGFNAVHLIEKKPGILALTAETVRTKVRILNAAARAWGWEEAEQQAIRLVQEWPVILTYSPTKLRTLARMASSAFEARDGATVRGTEVSALVTANLEQAVVAYLENEGEIIRPKDVVRLAKQYKGVGKQALRERILSERHDPVVVSYLRG